MKHKLARTFVTLALSVGIFASQLCSTSVDAANTTFKQQISLDRYQRSISKGFLGKSYGVGRNRYVCNTYGQDFTAGTFKTSARKTKSLGVAFKVYLRGADGKSSTTMG